MLFSLALSGAADAGDYGERCPTTGQKIRRCAASRSRSTAARQGSRPHTPTSARGCSTARCGPNGRIVAQGEQSLARTGARHAIALFSVQAALRSANYRRLTARWVAHALDAELAGAGSARGRPGGNGVGSSSTRRSVRHGMPRAAAGADIRTAVPRPHGIWTATVVTGIVTTSLRARSATHPVGDLGGTDALNDTLIRVDAGQGGRLNREARLRAGPFRAGGGSGIGLFVARRLATRAAICGRVQRARRRHSSRAPHLGPCGRGDFIKFDDAVGLRTAAGSSSTGGATMGGRSGSGARHQDPARVKEVRHGDDGQRAEGSASSRVRVLVVDDHAFLAGRWRRARHAAATRACRRAEPRRCSPRLRSSRRRGPARPVPRAQRWHECAVDRSLVASGAEVVVRRA
jgi:hypothetical protein